MVVTEREREMEIEMESKGGGELPRTLYGTVSRGVTNVASLWNKTWGIPME